MYFRTMYDYLPKVLFVGLLIGAAIILIIRHRKQKVLAQKLAHTFPEHWRTVLNTKINFYAALDAADRLAFEKRIQLFLATKTIQGIEISIDDDIRLLVAASAVIPTFAFPDYNYPFVHSVLIYPSSFNSQFETNIAEGTKKNILGMVASNNQDGTVILSKPDLERAFDGGVHKENVGIHEFVHMLDKEDGAIDGIPEILIEYSFVGPWLHEIKNEIKRIEKGHSDIKPYALASNAEFLAVVSEYFFTNPDKFKRRHTELYSFLSRVYNRTASPQAKPIA